MRWNYKSFQLLYESIQEGNIDLKLLEVLIPDLKELNLVNNIPKNEKSRSMLQKGEVTLSDMSTYSVNQEFVIAAVTFSDEMDLDEIVVAELILSNIDDEANLDTLGLVTKGKIAFFLRRQYILQILNYIVNCLPADSDVFKKFFVEIGKNKQGEKLLECFNSIHQQLSELKQQVNKAIIIGEDQSVIFNQNIKFKRDFLLKEYDILGQILFGIIKKRDLVDTKFIENLIEHISSRDADDFFIVYYLPSIFQAFIDLEQFDENEVKSLHSSFVNQLKTNQNLFEKPAKVCIIFVFLAFFIGWCKNKPESRAKVVDFQSLVDEPMMMAVELGAIEQLLIYSADTSLANNDSSIDVYYDMRSLLERHIPRLSPIQLIDNKNSLIYAQSTKRSNSGDILINSYQFDSSITRLSDDCQHIFTKTFHTVLQVIIGDCAFLLTRIKDAEEDSLLSGEDLNLDDVSAKADLERFFLTLYFFYYSREELASVFWQDKESNAYGFVEWASKCTDSLMRSCFYLLISSLSCGPTNSLNVFHYFNNDNNFVSWDVIKECISQYTNKIQNLKNVLSQKQQTQESEKLDKNVVALDEGLNEETIIFLSSLLTLIGSVAKMTNIEVKSIMSNSFSSMLFEFAELETPLVGACLTTLSYLVPSIESQREKFWLSLDEIIFKSAKLTTISDSYKHAFTSSLTNFSEVLGFLKLFKKLTDIVTTEPNSKFLKFGTLTFPKRLGQNYRKCGVWPYYDYIIKEVFVKCNRINDATSKTQVRFLIMDILLNSLKSFDYSTILHLTSINANLDLMVDSTDFLTYVQESSATAIFNYLFTANVYESLFQIVSIGIDQIELECFQKQQQLCLIEKTLTVIHYVLTYQETYIEELHQVILKNNKPEYFVPKEFGLHGLRTFYDAIFFNLPAVCHLGLYVGSGDYDVVHRSLQILEKLSVRSLTRVSSVNRVMTIFDSVDDSARIKESMIFQMEQPIEREEGLKLKLEILHFINTNLSYNDPKLTVAHSLLGFQISGNVSLGPSLATFINSETSLLSSIISILKSSLDHVTDGKISYALIRLAADSLEILLKLCRNVTTSHLILDYLSSMELYDTLMNFNPQVGKYTLWNGRIFDDNSVEDCREFVESESVGAVLFFMKYKSFLQQYLSLTIHRLSKTGIKSQVASLVKKLVSSTMYSAGIFSFLDTSSFGYIHRDHEMEGKLKYLQKVPINFEKMHISNNVFGNIYDYHDLNSLLTFAKRNYLLSNSKPLTIVPVHDMDQISSSLDEDIKLIKSSVTNYLSHNAFMDLQLSIIHSWVQLVQIIVTDGDMSALSRSNFVLEVFGTVVPKINDYIEYDVTYSKELVALTVFLFDIYQKDRLAIDSYNKTEPRLYDLFKACINGINSSVASFSLRADFYVLANNYLSRITHEKSQAIKTVQDIKMNGNRLIEIISSDAIFGEGTNRITSILLLDSLYQLGASINDFFVLDSLTNDTNLMLLIRSLKNFNMLSGSSIEGLSIDFLLYELTALKTTIYLMIRIAETRGGAQKLIQNQLFSTIEECSFLKLDPDFGLEISLENGSNRDLNSGNVKFNLDHPLILKENSNELSLYEFTVPMYQLIAAVLISMGSSNRAVIESVRKLLKKFRSLNIGILKRDALKDSTNALAVTSPTTLSGLQQMVKLIVVLTTLTDYNEFNHQNNLAS